MPNITKQHPSNYFEIEVTHLARERFETAVITPDSTLFFLADLPGSQSYVMTDTQMGNVDNRQILGFVAPQNGAGPFSSGVALKPVRFTLPNMPSNPFNVEMFLLTNQDDGTTLRPFNQDGGDENLTSKLFMIWTIKEISP